jgi:hypothetical protein
MLLKILNVIERLFPKNQHQSEIERFIVSKQPSTAAEVEHWMQVYDRRSNYVL